MITHIPPILVEIPMDRQIAESYSRGIPIVVENPSYIPHFLNLFKKVEELYESSQRK